MSELTDGQADYIVRVWLAAIHHYGAAKAGGSVQGMVRNPEHLRQFLSGGFGEYVQRYAERQLLASGWAVRFHAGDPRGVGLSPSIPAALGLGWDDLIREFDE